MDEFSHIVLLNCAQVLCCKVFTNNFASEAHTPTLRAISRNDVNIQLFKENKREFFVFNFSIFILFEQKSSRK